jgi:hypothetical protein
VDQVKEIYQVYARKHSKKITFKRLFVYSLDCTILHLNFQHFMGEGQTHPDLPSRVPTGCIMRGKSVPLALILLGLLEFNSNIFNGKLKKTTLNRLHVENQIICSEFITLTTDLVILLILFYL